jgi:hypothetical protein
MATAPSPAKPASAPAPARPSLADQTDLARVMYYGDPGKGKTTAAAHMAKLGTVIYIDAENRLKGGPLKALDVPIANIEPHTDVTYDDLMELSFDIQQRIEDGEKIVGIVWDSATETSRVLLQKLVDDGVRQAAQAGKERDPWATQLSDYGSMTEQMRRIIRRFRDLPVHLVITCLPNRDTDEEGSVRIAPALTPAVLRDFMGYMDVVLHMRMELINNTEEYSALTKPFGKWEAKDSFGVFPRILINPTFDRVLGYINGDLTADRDPIQKAAKEARAATAAEAK